MKTSADHCDTGSFAQQAPLQDDTAAQQAGRLFPEKWEDAELTPLPFPSWLDQPVAPSKLDPMLLRAKMRGEAVYADERGLLL